MVFIVPIECVFSTVIATLMECCAQSLKGCHKKVVNVNGSLVSLQCTLRHEFIKTVG